MKKLFSSLALAAAFGSLLISIRPLFAQGTAFTYQGQLQNNGSPANGNYDFTFALFNNDSTNSAQVGSTLLDTSVGVTNGLFTVTLDFGSVFTGNPTWLSIAVRTNGGVGFTPLSPLQELTPTPYATYAPNAGVAASAASVLAANVVGTISAGQLPAVVVTNGTSGVDISGTFSGNGAGVTNVALGSLSSIGDIFWGNFTLSSSPGVGSDPFSVCAADVNGDGKVDLICANRGDNTLMVLTNNGSGGFVTSGTYPVGDGPWSVCAADVNGDGKVDLICANLFGHSLTVLTNNGSGGFVTSGTYGVGTTAISVCAADVNGDGKVDLICATSESSTLIVLTNNGSGGFVISGTYGVGADAVSVCAADVNGDGRVDLISANFLDGTLTVLTNNGSGGFVTSGTYGVDGIPQSVCAADVNGDGKVDLISANADGNSLTVLTNNGSGGFVTSGNYGVGSAPNFVCAADVNGDGKVDLICAIASANSLTVLTNNGSGGFVTSGTYGVGSDPLSVCAADVNGDGKVDLISANAGGNSLTVLLNTPVFNGAFSGNGAGLTNLTAANLTGALPAISGTNLTGVALLSGGNSFTGNQAVNGTVTATSFSGGGSGLTSLPAGNLTGPLPAISGTSLTGVALLSGGNSFTGNQSVNGTVAAISFSGGGTSLSGVALLLGDNSFTGDQSVTGTVTAISFSGSGSGLTSLPAGNLTGPLPAISGANLTSLPAGNLTGSLPAISGANLTAVPPTVALLSASQTFTGQNNFTGNNVGIGTTSPTQAALVVTGRTGSDPETNYGYLFTGGAGTGGTATFVDNSIYASGNILAFQFAAFSDARIKRITGRSDAAHDLATLLGIEVTDYSYIDTVSKGSGKYKKVIAQQVEKLYPQAVRQSTDVVPDIYQRAAIHDGWVKLATNLKEGERVKLIGRNEEGIHEVLEVRDGAFRTDYKPATDKVFVYGREVKDFRTVDYEAISMLNISATQELARKVDKLQDKLNQTLAVKETLLKHVADLEARDQAREDRLARIESALKENSVHAKYTSLTLH
jgi:hypothetical protein